jgi:hypothetical protein
MEPEVPEIKRNFPSVMAKINPLCANARTNLNQELFLIGYLFGKFKMQKFEEV